MDKNEKRLLYGRIKNLEKEVKQLRTLINNKQSNNTPTTTYQKQTDGSYLLTHATNIPINTTVPLCIPINQPFLSVPNI